MTVRKFATELTQPLPIVFLRKMGLATTQTKVCFVTPIPFRSPRGHLQSLKVATPPSFLFSPAVCEQVPTTGYNKKALQGFQEDGIGYYADFSLLRDAHPLRSPRGHLQSLKVATPLSFLFYPAICEQVSTTGYNKKSLARLSRRWDWLLRRLKSAS